MGQIDLCACRPLTPPLASCVTAKMLAQERGMRTVEAEAAEFRPFQKVLPHRAVVA